MEASRHVATSIVRPEREFLGCRASLQRLHDAQIFGGWVEEISHNQCGVLIKSTTHLNVGESYFLEVHGPRAALQVKTTCAAVEAMPAEVGGDDPYLTLYYMSPPAFAMAREKCRKRILDATAIIRHVGVDFDGRLIDMSMDGAGILLQRPIEKGAMVSMSVTSNRRQINVRGEIRHVRQTGNVYLAGLLLTDVDRVQKVLWQELFDTV